MLQEMQRESLSLEVPYLQTETKACISYMAINVE